MKYDQIECGWRLIKVSLAGLHNFIKWGRACLVEKLRNSAQYERIYERVSNDKQRGNPYVQLRP